MPEKIEEGQALPPGTPVISPPRYEASGFSLASIGNEVILLCTQFQSGVIPGNEGIVIQSAPVLQISMSPQSLKDLHAIIGDRIVEHEKQFGLIETEFSSGRQMVVASKSPARGLRQCL